jgi:hypothetical protein
MARAALGRSDENECEQARTQQCQADASQGKKSASREVTIAHVHLRRETLSRFIKSLLIRLGAGVQADSLGVTSR